MNTKECTKCNIVKPLDQYCKQARGKYGVQPACKDCMNVLYKISRNKNIDHYKKVASNRTKKLTEYVREYKSSHGCTICQEYEPACLEFHHLDPKEKDFIIANKTSISWEKLLKEIQKCVVLCSNCHKKVHADIICLI